MSDFSDNWIDEQLRDVPLPAELTARLREIAALGDREVDFLLRDVSLPSGLADRLHAIGSLTDTDLDDDARHVAIPQSLVPRLRGTVRQQVRYSQLARLAIAATLLFAFTGVGWLLISRFKPADNEILAGNNAPSRTADLPQPPSTPASKLPSPSPSVAPKTVQAAEPKSPDAHPHETPASPANDAVAVSPVPMPVEPDPVEPDVSDDRPTSQSIGPMAGVLGNSALVTQPNLRIARGLIRQGIIGPRIKGYDLLFELNKGEHPAVHPTAAPSLAESHAPVWTETSSYELVPGWSPRGSRCRRRKSTPRISWPRWITVFPRPPQDSVFARRRVRRPWVRLERVYCKLACRRVVSIGPKTAPQVLRWRSMRPPRWLRASDGLP